MKADLPVCRSPKPDDWVANCGVCDGNFMISGAEYNCNPQPAGGFCPDCRANKRIAPGVLHWRRREE